MGRFDMSLARCRTAIAGILALGWSVGAGAANLAVSVENVEEYKGELLVAVYAEPKWLQRGGAAGSQILDLTEIEAEGNGGMVRMSVDLEPGEYGAVVFQDLNGNRDLDTNFIGMPKEPYGFSQNFSKMRRPKFDDCKFVVGEDGAEITIRLK